MKRSETNAIMRGSLEFLAERRFALPPFARWTPGGWREAGVERADIPHQQLGWDVTDFGSGDYARIGLLLFTLRNGTPADLALPGGKTYGEKVLVVGEGQVTPTHYHHKKREDIINRGGGKLVLNLWNSTDDGEGLARTPVTVAKDGVQTTFAAGGELTLTEGESVCLPQRLWHTFRGRGGRVLVGEVSRVNDDRTDNRTGTA